MPRARSRVPSLLGVLAASVPGAADAAQPTLPDQVLVLRAPSATNVEARHVPGDQVVELTVRRPPPDTVTTLSEQRGPFVRDVEHVELRAGTLTVLLRLSTDAATVETRRLFDPSGWAISLTPNPVPPRPRLAEMVGHLPGLVPPPHRPALFPVAPEDTPCTGNPDARVLLAETGQIHLRSELDLDRRLDFVVEPICRSWVVARLAMQAVEQGRRLEPFERWAFLFDGDREGWHLHPEARAHASLVASEILARRGYVPEAEALLADRARYREHHAPFRAMGLGNLFAIQGEHDEAETLYRQLVAEGFDPWMIHQASLARALNALEGGDALGALAHVERAARLLTQVEAFPGDIWVVGGEAALARDELRLAREHFERAARSDRPEARALGLLRLADLEARAGRAESALEGWKVAQAVGMPCIDDLVRLRRILALEKNEKETLRFLASQSQYSRCGAVRMEADFARAIIHVKRGEERLAIEPAVRLAAEGVSRWGPARPHRSMITLIARSAVDRLVRHRNPAELVAFFEEELERFAHLLDPRTRLQVGRAYDAIGASMRGAEELLALLTDHPELPFREELVLALGEALLRAGDIYRTGLVLRHLEVRHTPGRYPWRRLALAGRHEQARGRPDRALELLDRAATAAPSGDPSWRLSLDRARSLLDLGRPAEAGSALVAAAQVAALPRTELHAPAIEALSECARACARGTLIRLARGLMDRLGREFLSPRLVSRLARRGALEAAAPADHTPLNDPELWSRLDALGIAPGPLGRENR